MSGKTGAAECVKVEYDPTRITLESLVQLFMLSINPTSVNRQGNDVGPQYRSGIYYTDMDDAHTVFNVVSALEDSYDAPFAVEILPLEISTAPKIIAGLSQAHPRRPLHHKSAPDGVFTQHSRRI